MEEFNEYEYRMFLTRLTLKELRSLYGFIKFYGGNDIKVKLRLIYEEIECRRVLEMR